MTQPATSRGTQLSERYTEPVVLELSAKGRTMPVGNFDRSRRLFQTGGFGVIYYARNVISLSNEVWALVQEELDCDWIEMVDHKAGVCYSIAVEKAGQVGAHYVSEGHAREGRYGIPVEAWTKNGPAIEPAAPDPVRPVVPVQRSCVQCGSNAIASGVCATCGKWQPGSVRPTVGRGRRRR